MVLGENDSIDSNELPHVALAAALLRVIDVSNTHPELPPRPLRRGEVGAQSCPRFMG